MSVSSRLKFDTMEKGEKTKSTMNRFDKRSDVIRC
jgi:hypothetical protein